MYRSALPTHCSARESGARDAHLIFYATGLLFVVGAVWLFNRLVRLRNQVRNAWSDVDVQLQRRHDLVPIRERRTYDLGTESTGGAGDKPHAHDLLPPALIVPGQRQT